MRLAVMNTVYQERGKPGTQRLTAERRHVFEAEMKERRRTHGHLAQRAATAESAPELTKE